MAAAGAAGGTVGATGRAPSWVCVSELGNGVTWLKILVTFADDGANSANCLVNSPGGQPGTIKSSATLVKSRSLNGK